MAAACNFFGLNMNTADGHVQQSTRPEIPNAISLEGATLNMLLADRSQLRVVIICLQRMRVRTF